MNFDHILPFSNNFSLHSQIKFNSVSYFDLTDFNTEDLYLSTGPKKILNRFLLSLPLIYDYTRVGSESYSQSFGASPSVKYALTHNLYLAGNIYAAKRNYYDRDNRDGELYSFDLSLKKVFKNWFIRGGSRYTLEKTEKEFLDNDAWSLYAAFYAELPLDFSLYISPEISWEDYDEREAAFDQKREDDIYTVNVNLSKEFGGSGYAVTCGYTYTRDDANLPIYDYTRNQVTFQVSKQF